jgi:hypothetical protein
MAALITTAVLFLDAPVGAAAPWKGETTEHRIVTAGQPATFQALGVRLIATARLSHSDVRNPILGFDLAIQYSEPASNDIVNWMGNAFIQNHHDTQRTYGPFLRAGTRFLIFVRVDGSESAPRLDFTLASDRVIANDRVTDRPVEPPFTLLYGERKIAGVATAKTIYQVFGMVKLAYKMTAVMRGVAAPQTLGVDVLINVIEDKILSYIPESYEDLTGYRCNSCGRVENIEPFSGCRLLEFHRCGKARANVCLKPN